MTTLRLKSLALFAGLTLGAVLLGVSIAEGDYFQIILGVVAITLVAGVLSPGYVPLMAAGLALPIYLPLPYALGLPMLAAVLGFCVLKLAITYPALGKRQVNYRSCFDVSMIVLFGIVALHYLSNPALPNRMGTLQGTTGFRAYFSYGICFATVAIMGFVIRSREEMISLFRKMVWWSVVVAVLLMICSVSRSGTAAIALTQMGIFVTAFDNGLLRFVVLSGSGMIILSLALLPELMPLRASTRAVLVAISLAAVIAGGSRTGVVTAVIIILTILWLRQKHTAFGVALGVILLTFAGLYYVGENFQLRRGVGMFRIASIISPRAAEISSATETYKWRMLRWERAIQDIRANPLFGVGYGGLQNLVFSADQEAEMLEMDLAAGSIHNGYLAIARAFGIPALLVFVFCLLKQIVTHWRFARKGGPASSQQRAIHMFFCANLLAYVVELYLGSDANSFELWAYIALGMVAVQLNAHASSAQKLTAIVAPAPTKLEPKFGRILPI